jgi:HKD family nuclease
MTLKTSFITNTNETHREFLTDCLNQADKIIFAVGFLKQSGLNNIIENLKAFCADNAKIAKFFIGTGLGETDPDTLQQLYNVLKKREKHQLILCTPDAGIFHPKIYVFIKGRKATIVTGSSNLTHHGWEVNDEVSMISETTIDSTEFVQLDKYFQKLEKKYFAENTEQLIDKYKKDRDEHLKNFGKPPAFRFKRKRTTIPGIDMPRLKRYYEIYKNSNYYIEPEDREEQYRKAQLNLDVLASKKSLSAKEFHNYFGPLVGHKDYKPKLWHSGSIHRTTYKTLDYADSFREIVRAVKLNHTKPTNEAFNNVISLLNKMKANKSISGIGANIVTEIFLSYNPEKFANLNDNPIAVLSLVGKDYLMSYFKGDDYKEYVELLLKIREELKMNTFLEIDSFFNFVYWNMLEE